MNVERLVATATVALVAGGLIAGFTLTGSPSHQRALQVDEQRIDDLRALADKLHQRYGTAGARRPLPERLGAADAPSRTDGSDALTDPLSGAPYRYQRLDAHTYRLCASFATSMRVDASGNGEWPHPRGAACWRMTVEADPPNWPDVLTPEPPTRDSGRTHAV